MSQLADKIYAEYLEIFQEMWGMAPSRSVILGQHGNGLFEAEFAENGVRVYDYSVIQAIRNAWYSWGTMQARWDHWLARLEIEEPVLDYGCGVGFQLRWLDEMGVEGLHGVDLGVNRKVLAKMEKRSGIKQVDFASILKKKFKTIFCVHVLEHVERPLLELEYIRKRLAPGGKLYAGCVMTEGHGHIAPMKERELVLESLREQGELIEWEPQPVNG